MFDQVSEFAVWLIFFLPLISLCALLFLPRSLEQYAGHILAGCAGAAFLLSLWVLDSSVQAEGQRLEFAAQEWLRAGGLSISVGLNVDGLAAIMMVVVTAVSFLVQVYSVGYMHGDTGYWRYFAFMSLFTMSMLGLVMLDSLVMVYVFWEMVGLSSYLLIGFWFDRPEAAAAAKKAFLVTRLGDIGFLLAILLIYTQAGTFEIEAIQEMALAGAIGSTALTFFALGVFAGAAGKSAQFPFHVWLPEAMEGPTPVSALIHSATMVAAGVYLVARMFPVFQTSADAMAVVGAIGGVTALGAALLALVMTDIKRVLAYSTISQLGFMMLALGIGAYVAAIFHLVTHAFFKSLLFLGAGSVNHATNTFDLRQMGGLRQAMPVTFATFLIASLSLAGLVPLAGFWSKDAILSVAWVEEPYLFWIGFIAAGLTAFYIFRVVFLTFMGEYHGGADTAQAEERVEPHEAPGSMIVPMLALAVPAVLAGLLNLPWSFLGLDHEIEQLLLGALPDEALGQVAEFRWGIAAASTAVTAGGIVLAWLVYGARVAPASLFARALRPAHRLLENRYYLDALYERVIVGFLFYRVLAGAMSLLEGGLDGAVDGLSRGVRGTAGRLRYVQSGQYQTYGAIAFSGLALTAIVVLVLSPL